MKNPYSWTAAGVNLLAVESPVGVGFSYCSNGLDKKSDKGCYADDTTTAAMNKAALIDFYEKFPELEGGDLYISGTFGTRLVLRIHSYSLALLSMSLGVQKIIL